MNKQPLQAREEQQPRRWCYACRRPRVTCLCASITRLATRSRCVLLTHPLEYRRVRIGTGRITHLSLPNSEVHVGVDFSKHKRINEVINDCRTESYLLYPDRARLNLSRGEYMPQPQRPPVFFLIDSTWTCAKKVLRRSGNVRALPRVGFDLVAESDFAIKRQPDRACLATIEAAHRCLMALAAHGHEILEAEDGRRLLAPFLRIMEIQQDYPGAPLAAVNAR